MTFCRISIEIINIIVIPFSDINSVAHIVETLRSKIDLSVILDLNAYTTRYLGVHVYMYNKLQCICGKIIDTLFCLFVFVLKVA